MEKPPVQYLLRLYQNIDDDLVGLLAAGVAFYFFLASFPAIAALISLYGLFSDPSFVANQIDSMSGILPADSLKILSDQARSITSTSNTALGFGVIVGIVLTIYSTTKGVSALIKGLNIAYNEKERRNIVALNFTAFMLTFVMMAYLLFALSMIALMPAVLHFMRIPDSIETPLLLLRWPLLLLTGVGGLQIVYNFAPCHSSRRHPWASWGALVATVFWIGGSSLFSLFVSNFGKYNETYGSLGAVAVLLLWFWLSAMCVLLGAEVNAAFTVRENKATAPADALKDT